MRLQWKHIELMADLMKTIKSHNINLYHQIKIEANKYWSIRKICD